ncbi:MAG: T9SS type A sorting domain-containing protein [Bacteroidia bacterium]
MKKISLLFLLNFHLIIVKGQNMLTIGEVFDFNINDEFQSKDYSGVPPNAVRIKIIGKHFSANNDTIFYSFHYDNYTSVPDMTTSPPHLVYIYSIGEDSIFYTSLDSLINFQSNPVVDSCNFFHDTLYYSAQHCGSEVYEYNSCIACCFEGQQYNFIYGKGLGVVRDFHNNSDPLDYVNVQRQMFYYRKGTLICGVSDPTVPVTINEKEKTKNDIILYPNPAKEKLNLTNITHQTSIELFDMFGKRVLAAKSDCNTILDINELIQGIYTVVATDKERRNCYRIVITKE